MILLPKSSGRPRSALLNAPLSRLAPVIFKGLFVLFLALAGLHFSTNRPLWLDENFVLVNLNNYQGAELFRVLDHSQAFPRLHLAALQAFSALWGYELWSLRFFSFLMMSAAVAIWLALYRKFSVDPAGAVLAALALVVSFRTSYYAYELKPYAADVLVAALYALVLADFKEGLARKPFFTQTAVVSVLAFAGLWSYASLFVVWMVPYSYALLWARGKSPGRCFVMSLGVTALWAAVFYYLDLRHTLGVPGLQGYWQSYFINVSSARGFLDTFGDGLKKIVTHWYGPHKLFIKAGIPLIPFFCYALAAGGGRALRQDRGGLARVSSIGLALFLQMMAAGALQKYPFTGQRVTLFFAPFVFFFTVEGIRACRKPRWLRRAVHGYFLIYLAAALASTVYQYLWHY